MFRQISTVAVIGFTVVMNASSSSAQQLVWDLPPDGTWVRFEGTFQQTQIRPEDAEGNYEIPPWIQHVTVKSVGQEMGEYDSKSVPCRWIEIKSVLGRERDGALDPGLTGAEIYKVLVPESKVIGKAVDDSGVPLSFLPVVKGYRQIGKAQPKPLEAGALQVYPLVTLMAYYRTLATEAEQVDPEIGLGPVKADRLKGVETQERRSSRTTQETTLWRSKEVPFGLARWSVKVVREKKGERAPRAEFQPSTEVTIEMKAQETGTGAQSELAAP